MPTTNWSVCAVQGCHFIFVAIKPISLIAFFIFAPLSVAIIWTFSLNSQLSNKANNVSDIFCAVCGYLIYSTAKVISCITKFLSRKEHVTPKNPCLFLAVHISVVRLTEIAFLFKISLIQGRV